MTTADVRATLLDRYGLRAEPAMQAYILDRLAQPDRFPILAGDARTGLPVRQVIVPAEFTAPHIAS